MRKKITPFIIAVAALFLAACLALGSILVNQIGLPLPWLHYQWREPSYAELIQYQNLWFDFFFWLAAILASLSWLKKLKKLTFSLKKTILYSALLVLLALDWAALHDIFKGEPHPSGEYLILIFSILIFSLIGFCYAHQKRSHSTS